MLRRPPFAGHPTGRTETALSYSSETGGRQQKAVGGLTVVSS